MNKKTTPKAQSPHPKGFALIIALTLMSFMVILVLSLATFLNVEMHTASHQSRLDEARQNAILGAQIALGQLQIHVGPDQRVTAAATIAYPEKTGPGQGELWDIYRNNATGLLKGDRGVQWRTFLAERPLDEGGGGNSKTREDFELAIQAYWDGKNPHWMGVWESETRVAADGSEADQGEFDRAQTPRWLVSGNENRAIDDQITPDTVLPDPEVDPSVVYLVGTGSAVLSAEAHDGLDGRVKAFRVPVFDGGGALAKGHYAFWIGDESLKANFSMMDPYYDEPVGSRGYRNRLQSPQRTGWENLTGFKEIFESPDGAAITPNDPKLERITTTSQIPLLDEEFVIPARQGFHHLTGYSKGIFTDTARGGLRKDLTRYLDDGSGLNDNDPIPDPSDYDDDDRFGMGNQGFPNSDDYIPTWGQIRDWSRNEATGGGAGTVEVGEGFKPMLTNLRIMVGFSQHQGKVRFHILPSFVLWNPFDAGLDNASYELRVAFSPKIDAFQVVTENKRGAPDTGADPSEVTYRNHTGAERVYYHHEMTPTAATHLATRVGVSIPRPHNVAPDDGDATGLPAYNFEPFEDGMVLTLRFNTNFEPGESLVFSVMNEQDITSETSGGGSEIAIDVENGFDPDFPLTAFVDIFTMNNPPDPADPTQSSHFFATGGELRPSGRYEVSLSGNGFLLFENPEFGRFNTGSQGFGRNLRNAQRAGNFRHHPMHWRPLPTTDKLVDVLPKLPISTNTNHPSSPILMAGKVYIEPFMLRGDWLFSSREAISGNYRAFAQYNLNALLAADSHLTIDRNTGGFQEFGIHRSQVYNAESPPSIEYWLTGVTVSGAYQKGFPWDDDTARDHAGRTRGYSLVSHQFMQDRMNVPGLSELPVRMVKRPGSNIVSLGQLQQVNLSPYIWQPSYPIGNSEASVYVARDQLSGWYGPTRTITNDSENQTIDLSYLLNDALWDRYFLSGIPSTGALSRNNSDPLPNSRIRFRPNVEFTDEEARDFDDAARFVLNEGAFNVNSTSVEAWKGLLTAFRDLQLSVQTTLPGDISTEPTENPSETVPVSLSLQPLFGPVGFAFANNRPLSYGASNMASGRNYSRVISGFRYLDDDMIEALAERIVDEVRLRGPFLSISDFVNRRLVAPDRSTGEWDTARTDSSADNNEYMDFSYDFIKRGYDPLVGLHGLGGALNRAIQVSGINGGVNYPEGLASVSSDRIYKLKPYTVQVSDSRAGGFRFIQYPTMNYYLDSEHIAGAPVGEQGQFFSHAPGFVTQADLLSMIGPALTARGDTFTIRSYGDAVNPLTGEISAKAWLEVVVQRVPEPVLDADGDYEPDLDPEGRDTMGRRFEIVSFHWLSESEI